MKVVVAAFNQEKALIGAFSVIVKTGCGPDGSICGTSSDGDHNSGVELECDPLGEAANKLSSEL